MSAYLETAGTHRHRRVRLPNGLRLHVVEEGPDEAEAVLLLHGWPQTSYAWRRVSPLLAAAGLHTVAPDLRGFGHSAKPDGGFDKKTVARDCLDLADHLGIERFWVVGHDMGGQVAFPLAAQWPERVKGLVFIEAGLPGYGQERAMDIATGGSWHFGFNRSGDIAEALVHGREQLFIRAMIYRETVGVFVTTAISDEDINVYAASAALPGALRCMFGYYRALLPTDRDDNLALGNVPLTMPVLAIGSDHGYGETAADTMRKLAIAPESWIASQCGHYVPEERPAELADRLLAFFGAHLA